MIKIESFLYEVDGKFEKTFRGKLTFQKNVILY